MAYPRTFIFNLSTSGLTLKWSLIDTSNAIHATLRDQSATAIGNGVYSVYSASFPDAYRGSLVTHTSSVGVGTDFSGVTVKAAIAINPGELERLERMLPVASEVVFVPHVAGDDTTSGTNLRTAVEGANSTTPRIVVAEPGVYDTGATTLTFPAYCSLWARDREATIISGSLASGPNYVPSSLTTIEGVTLRNTSTGDVFGRASGTVANCAVRNARLLGGTNAVNFSSSGACLFTLEKVIARPGTGGVLMSGAAHEMRVDDVQTIILSTSATYGLSAADGANIRGGRWWITLPNASAGEAIRLAGGVGLVLNDSNLYAKTASVNITDGASTAVMKGCQFDRSLVLGSASQLADLDSLATVAVATIAGAVLVNPANKVDGSKIDAAISTRATPSDVSTEPAISVEGNSYSGTDL